LKFFRRIADKDFMDGIAAELRAWHYTGLRIAIWGGAGESADFLQTHGLDALQFPMIRSLDWLLENPADIILIPSEYRAAEIVHQIDAARIAYDGILIPREGRLVDFHAAAMVVA
jgi:hypothetical protein